MAIKERVKKVLSDSLSVSSHLLADETKLSDIADDFDKVEIVVRLEDAFDIKLLDEEVGSSVTITDVVDCVKSKVRSTGGDKDYDAVLSKLSSQFGVSISRKVAENFKSFQELVNYIYNFRA